MFNGHTISSGQYRGQAVTTFTTSLFTLYSSITAPGSGLCGQGQRQSQLARRQVQQRDSGSSTGAGLSVKHKAPFT